jgi:2-oxoisovalerate dehydrogenase E1 component
LPKNYDVLPEFDRGQLTFDPIPTFSYQGDLATELQAGLAPHDAWGLLDSMLYVRLFEEMIIRLKDGKFDQLPGLKFIGATHLSIGQEAVAVGAMSALQWDDLITSTHRGHGHSVAKGYYWLQGASVDQLAAFIGTEVDLTDRPGLLDCALQVHLNRAMAELFGKEEGYCRGRGGGMHIADFNMGHLGANAIVGGSYAIAAGAALACDKLSNGKVCLCLIGDGATNNGIAHEAYNFATMSQFKRGLPVVYLIENNQYGMTGQQRNEVTGVDYLARRGSGYNRENMHAEVVNGMDVLAVRDAVARATELCRNGEGPVLLEAMTYRYMGHSLSDDRTTYRSKEEEAAWRAQDALDHYQEQLTTAGLATADKLQVHRQLAQERIDRSTLFAATATDPDPSTIYEGLFADTSTAQADPAWETPAEQLVGELPKARRSTQALQRHTVTEALLEEMLRDKRVVLYGEDVADYGGAFAATRGLFEVFGRERVFNSAISEAAICGTACGAAMAGLRPVVELMYIDFVLMAMDQVGNQIAKNRYMFGGKAKLPLVIRTTIGGGKGYAGQHSQSLEAVVAMMPGLKVIAPATPADTKGLLKAAIRDDNPVIFIEHQLTYLERGEVPTEDYTIPLGVARVAREGTDVTLVAYSYMYYRAMAAAEALAAEGISVEVVDPRTLIPLDVPTIAASVRKTGRLVVVQQAPETGCFGEHIAYAVQREIFSSLQAPVRLVAACNVPPPMAPPLEQLNIPSVERIAAAVRETLRG